MNLLHWLSRRSSQERAIEFRYKMLHRLVGDGGLLLHTVYSYVTYIHSYIHTHWHLLVENCAVENLKNTEIFHHLHIHIYNSFLYIYIYSGWCSTAWRLGEEIDRRRAKGCLRIFRGAEFGLLKIDCLANSSVRREKMLWWGERLSRSVDEI